MKKLPLMGCLILALSSASVMQAQQLVENPAKPPAKNAGRIVSLERVLSIKETRPGEPLRGAYDIQVGGDGSIYFYDHFEFCKFSPEGKFIFKIVGVGMGPGEAQWRTVALVTGDGIVIQANTPPKVMWFDPRGRLQREMRIRDLSGHMYLFEAGGRLFGFEEGLPSFETKLKAGFQDFPTRLHEIAPDFQKQTEKAAFPVLNYVSEGLSSFYQGLFLEYVIADERTLFISHTPEYRIVKYDLGLNRIERSFRRKYARVARPADKERNLPPGVIPPPRWKYFVDVDTLLVRRNRLWAVTSTADVSRRHLVDVYDMDGHYLDSFYLEYPAEVTHARFSKGNIAVYGDRIYSIDEEADGALSVNVYRVRE